MLSDKEIKECTCKYCGYIDCNGDCKSITPNEYNELKDKIKELEKIICGI